MEVPFEIYYGRKENKLVHNGQCFLTDIEKLSATKQMKNWRKSAKAADDRMAKVMHKKHARKNTYTT